MINRPAASCKEDNVQTERIIQKDTTPQHALESSQLAAAERSSHRVSRQMFMLIVAASVALLALMAACPTTAFAKDYSCPQVTIDATVEPDGDLHVVESRTFDFDGSFTCVWWDMDLDDLPEGSQLVTHGVSITQGGETSKLYETPFVLSWRDAGGPGTTTYSVDEGYTTIYLFFHATDEQIVGTIDYTITDAVTKYSDVGELYWQFVASGWAVDSENVDLTVHLPAPSGAQYAAGEEVRAWGHGPLDANVSIDVEGDAINYHVPRVSADTFAEARAVFPAEWLTGVESGDPNADLGTTMLDYILSEEQRWADEANHERMMATGGMLLMVLLCLGVCIWALISFFRYGKELKPNFTERYWRDVPERGVHPAIIGRLCRFGKESTDDFTATVMHLINEGVILVNRGAFPTPEGGYMQDYYLTLVPEKAAEVCTRIDYKTLTLLFDKFSKGQNQMWMEAIKIYADENPESFTKLMDNWQGVLTGEFNKCGYIETYSSEKRSSMAFVAVALFIISIAIVYFTENILVVLPALVTALVVGFISRYMERRTQHGADTYARSKALERWLREFSRLNERPMLDVKVWGEFMVYAFVFGIAREAIEELKRAVPEVFHTDPIHASDNSYVPWWGIYTPTTYGGGRGIEMPDIGKAVSHAVGSAAAAMSSSSSDGGGGGGGFSGGGGGGGGGFGGGGGGGAR